MEQSHSRTQLEQPSTRDQVVHFEVRGRQNVRFTEETIDNEHLNKKKSKSKSFGFTIPSNIVCCKYEKPNKLDSSSGSSCDSEGDEGNEYDKLPKHQKKKMEEKKHRGEEEEKSKM